MNYKKLACCAVAVFVTFFITDYLVHGVLMKSTYQATQHLWRPEAEMGKFMPGMMLGKFLVALFFAWIFLHGYKGKGVMEGFRFGLLIGGYSAGGNLIMYAVAPYDCSITCSWIVAGLAQGVIGGIVATFAADKCKK
jgi:hypothetical protein